MKIPRVSPDFNHSLIRFSIFLFLGQYFTVTISRQLLTESKSIVINNFYFEFLADLPLENYTSSIKC